MSAPRWKRPESVLVVVHAASGEVLLLQRADDPHFWQSVTGSLEEGETPRESARRELREETGLDLEPIDRRERTTFEIGGPWRARYAPGVTHNVEHVFEACVEVPCAIALSTDEHLAYRWLAPREALALVTSPTNERALRRALARRGGAGDPADTAPP